MILPTVPALICTQDEPGKLISIDFARTPLRSALESLFKSAGIRRYKIANDISGTVSLKTTGAGIDLEQALQWVIRESMEPVTYLKENGVWIVQLLPQATGTPSPPIETPARPVPSWVEIPLHFRTPQEFSELLGGIITLPYIPKTGPARVLSPDGKRFMMPPSSLRPPGVDNIVAVGNGRLLVQGDPEDTNRLRELIQQLDVAIPSVECRVEVVTVSDGKRSKSVLLQAMETGKCGTEIKAVSKFSGTPAQTSKLDVTLKATPLGGNFFEVETRWEGSIPLPGAQRGQLVRLEKTFSNTRRVKGGDTVMFGGVVIKEEQGAVKGGQEVLFFLTLKPL